MKIMAYVRLAALAVLLSVGVGALLNPRTDSTYFKPEPAPPLIIHWRPATPLDGLTHDLDLAQTRDHVKGWEITK